ncbi:MULTISPECIES: GNAT family N-acetyltransferase [unclassified Sinorhizobium]|uniref:GNAT family N-acetyltransferase n=1 Tax=unclassified Sinorhizobium TaxID=2613772 RepID=UPI003523EEB5
MRAQKLDFQIGRPDQGSALPAAALLQSAVAVEPAAGELRIDLFNAMEPLEADWRSLESDDFCSLHQSYDWCSAWTKTHGYPLAILRGVCDEKTLFILPMEIVGGRMGRIARFIASGHSNINTGLFSAEFLKAASALSSTELRTRIVDALKGTADLILLEKLALNWRGRESPLSALPAIENQNHAFQLPFLENFEATLKQVNAKGRRKKFRVQSRRLEAIGGYEHVIAAADEQHALLDVFFRQKAVRFKALGLPDVFDEPKERAFFHLLLDVDVRNDNYMPLGLHALRLKGEHAGSIVAIAALSRKGGHVICQFASIDQTLVPDTSPGEFLFWLIISHLHQESVALFDFGIGDQLYKRSWCPVETVHHDVILPISPRGHLAALAQRATTRAKIFIKKNPRIYSFIQRRRASGR